jgi:signal transduction histidine kinase
VGLGLLAAGDALYTQLSAHHVAFALWTSFAALAGAVSLWWRRSHPIEVTVLGLLICLTALIEWPLAVGLFTLTVRRRDRVTWILSAAAALALAAEYCVHRRGFYPGASLGYALPCVIFIGLSGTVLGMRRDKVNSLKERAERAEAEQELREEQARLNERTRIAREMHDVLAHRISLVALHAGGLEVTENPRPEAVHQTAALIRETSRQALEDLRSVLGVLHSTGDPDVELAPQPRFADIADLVAASSAAGVPVTLTLTGPLYLGTDVPEPVGRAAYRVVQESLTNIHKHAPGAWTEVRLSGAPGEQLLVAVENQRPQTPSMQLPGAGSGLVGLRERVSFVGGRLTAAPTSIGGFLGEAGLPWPAPSKAERKAESQRLAESERKAEAERRSEADAVYRAAARLREVTP